MPDTCVLVVEEQAIVQIDIEASLRELSIVDVHSVTTVDEGLNVLSSQPVDLLISEWKMSGVSCLPVLEHAWEKNVKTIIATAFDTARDLVGPRAGTVFINKPFSVDEFHRAIYTLFPALAR